MKNTIKIWPNLSDISQAIIPYSDSKINFDKIVHIDMSNILDINSSGVTLTLLKLAKLIKQNKHTRWSIIEPNVAIKSFIESVGFNNILSERIGNKDMFWTIKDVNQTSSFEQVNQQGLITHSFPIYYLNHTKNEHRISVEDFIDWVLLVLEDYSITYNFHLHIFLKLLKEIAKNSEDHTSDNAFFGMDLIKYPYSNKAQLLFSFCDLGNGIHENIKNHIKPKSNFGIVDSYKNAFRPGYSTTDNSINKGIGMSMILECMNLLEMELSIFDARSRGIIPPKYTHEEVRRNFWNIGTPVGFYYYGKVNIG